MHARMMVYCVGFTCVVVAKQHESTYFKSSCIGIHTCILLEIARLLIVKRSSVTSGIEVVLWTLLNSGIIQIYLSALDIHS